MENNSVCVCALFIVPPFSLSLALIKNAFKFSIHCVYESNSHWSVHALIIRLFVVIMMMIHTHSCAHHIAMVNRLNSLIGMPVAQKHNETIIIICRYIFSEESSHNIPFAHVSHANISILAFVVVVAAFFALFVWLCFVLFRYLFSFIDLNFVDREIDLPASPLI